MKKNRAPDSPRSIARAKVAAAANPMHCINMNGDIMCGAGWTMKTKTTPRNTETNCPMCIEVMHPIARPK